MVTPSYGLIDGDIIQYQASFAAEARWKYMHKERGEEVKGSPPWDFAEEAVEALLASLKSTLALTDSTLYFSGKENFREHLAVMQEYKGERGPRPFHYKNVKAYLQATQKCEEHRALEADDLISLAMRKNPGEAICITRDKDLRQIPGWHYGWENHNQPEFGPKFIDEMGYLERKGKKVEGGGLKFFFFQCLTGDRVDSIPGIPGYGPITALQTLEGLDTEQELKEAVQKAYCEGFQDILLPYGLGPKDRLFETANLVRMVSEMDDQFIHLYDPWEEFTFKYDFHKRVVTREEF